MALDANDILDIEEVSQEIQVTKQTISNWYKYKSENPKSDLAKKLPEVLRIGPRKARYWKRADLNLLVEFKNSVPKGRCGIMGSITQRYSKSKKQTEE